MMRPPKERDAQRARPVPKKAQGVAGEAVLLKMLQRHHAVRDALAATPLTARTLQNVLGVDNALQTMERLHRGPDAVDVSHFR